MTATTEQQWLGNAPRFAPHTEDFLRATFDITDAEYAHLQEVHAGQPYEEKLFGGIPGRPARGWTFLKVQERMDTAPLPEDFWTQVHIHQMLNDAEGQALVLRILKRRADLEES